MPTTVSKTIGTSGDYTTLQSWEDACPANLVTADQIWRGEVLNQEFVLTSTALTISGQTTDATRYVELTTATGASFIDNANIRTNTLRYNASNGAAIRVTVDYAHAIIVNTNYTRISKLQFSSTRTQCYGFSLIGAGNIIESCIFGGAGGTGVTISIHSSPPIIKNCLIYSESGATGLWASLTLMAFQPVYIINCTIIRPSNRSVSGTGINTDYAQNCIIRNNAIFNFSTLVDGQYLGTHTAQNNATDGASWPTFGTASGNLTSLTTTSQFEQPDASSVLDFRTKSGASLIDAGYDTSVNGVTTDISSTTRGTTYDIGVWEIINTVISKIKPFIFRRIY